MNNSEEFRFKIVVIGDGGVGKTSLIKKFTKGTFEKNYVKTIGAQFSKYVKEINGDKIDLLFWDIAGQETRFDFLHHLFYREGKAAIIVFSLEENELGQESFKHIKNWDEEVKKHCGNISVILFANKIDLVDQNNLDNSKIQEIVNERKFLGYFGTSAKTGQGVIKAFNAIINDLYIKYK
jgi:Ras-related protein Rab-23